MSKKIRFLRKHKPNVFQRCFPCFRGSKSSEIMDDRFGDEFTEYVYVIENLTIRRAPRALIDAADAKLVKTTDSDFKQNRKENAKTKKDDMPVHTLMKPVVKTEDDDSKSAPVVPQTEDKQKKKQLIPNSFKLDPCYLHLHPDRNTCQQCKEPVDKPKMDKEEILRRMLLPPSALKRAPPKLSFEAPSDFQNTPLRRNRDEKIIVRQKPAPPPELSLKDVPDDLRKTIAALKVARPENSRSLHPKKNLHVKIKPPPRKISNSNILDTIMNMSELEDDFSFSMGSVTPPETESTLPKFSRSSSPPRTKGTIKNRPRRM